MDEVCHRPGPQSVCAEGLSHGRIRGHGVDPVDAEELFPGGEHAADLCDCASYVLRVESRAHTSHMRKVLELLHAPATEVQSVAADFGGARVRATARTTVRSSVDLPVRGAPTTSPCPAAPEKSRYIRSRRCWSGRSTRPVGTRSPPSPSSGSHTRHRPAVPTSARSAVAGAGRDGGATVRRVATRTSRRPHCRVWSTCR